MSDASNRDIPAPPARRTGGAAALIKDNRASLATAKPDANRSISGPPPTPRRVPAQQIEPDTTPVQPVTAHESPKASALGESPSSITPGLETDIATQSVEPIATSLRERTEPLPSTPYTRRIGRSSEMESPDDIIKVTFEVRRGDRDAFNAAFGAASFNEGYVTPKELLQVIYTRETKRIEDQYNDGEPFPRRRRQAPRGRPIRADQ